MIRINSLEAQVSAFSGIHSWEININFVLMKLVSLIVKVFIIKDTYTGPKLLKSNGFQIKFRTTFTIPMISIVKRANIRVHSVVLCCPTLYSNMPHIVASEKFSELTN